MADVRTRAEQGDVTGTLAQSARSAGIELLTSISNFTLGTSFTEDWMRSVFGKKEFPTQAEVEQLVTKIISSKKIKTQQELDKILNQLGSIPIAKSAIQQKAIDKRVEELRKDYNSKVKQAGLADDLAQLASSTASQVGYASASTKKNLAETAKEYADKAAEAYDKVTNPGAVEKEI